MCVDERMVKTIRSRLLDEVIIQSGYLLCMYVLTTYLLRYQYIPSTNVGQIQTFSTNLGIVCCSCHKCCLRSCLPK